MRASTLVLVTLVAVAGAAMLAEAQAPGYLPQTISALYNQSITVMGRVQDADDRGAGRYPVRVEIDSPQGPVVKPIELLTTCYGDFDAFWDVANLSKRYTVRVTVDGQTQEQAVDVLHRRNDFTFRLDRALEPPEDETCAEAWNVSQRRATFTGQLLEETPPYPGPKGNILHARPVQGVPVHLRLTREDGSTFEPTTVFTNEQGAYKYSFVEPQPIRGTVDVWFESNPAAVQTVNVKDGDVKYYVVSLPPVRRGELETPPAAAVAALAVLALAALAWRAGRER